MLGRQQEIRDRVSRGFASWLEGCLAGWGTLSTWLPRTLPPALSGLISTVREGWHLMLRSLLQL